MIAPLIILFVFVLLIPASSYAQTNSSSAVVLTPTPSAITLVVPEHLLIGAHENYGLVVRENSEEPIIVILTASSDVLELPKTVFLGSGENHALFKISIHGTGKARVIAIFDNESYVAKTTIYNQINDDYRIVLSAPNSTSVSNVKVGVHLVDHFGNPIPAKTDIDIRFTTHNFDTLVDTVIIPESKSSIFVTGNVRGDAKISAYSKDSISDTVEISRVWNTAKVNLGIAPKIILDNSFGYLFIWIADENETQIIPHLPLSATIQTSNPASVGFTNLYKSTLESHQKIHISDGFHMMKIYTYEQGTSTITISIPGFGASSEEVTVGPAEKLDDMNCSDVSSTDNDDVDIVDDNDVDIVDDNPDKTNHICASIFPDAAISDAYLVLSLFDLMPGESELAVNATVSETRFYPKYSFEQDFLLSSDDSVQYDKRHVFEPQSRYTQSAVIPLSSRDVGEHTVTITSPKYPSLTVPFDVIPQKQYSFSISTLPFAKSGDVEPLFAVSITDESGHVIDPHFTFGNVSVDIITDDITLDSDSVVLRDPVSIISGIPKIKEPSIALVSDYNIMGKHHSKFNNTLQLFIDAPDVVHAGEQFAVYAYVADSSGAPIALSTSLDSDCITDDDDDILFVCQSDAEFILIEDSIGVMYHPVDVFTNSMDTDAIKVDFGDTMDVILYDEHPITVESNGADWIVNTAINHTVNDDGVVLYPDVSGVYDVSLIFSRSGYSNFVDVREIEVHNKVGIKLNTITTQNANFASDVTIVNLDGEHTVQTPDTINILRGENTITFPKNIQTESTGYIFEHMMWNSELFESNIFSGTIFNSGGMTAQYREVVNIRVTNALGSGVYDIGDTVTLHAPPRDVVSFLIRDVLDYWDHTPNSQDIYSDTVSFTALESFSTSAVYKQDFTGLVLVVVGAVFGTIAFRRKNDILGLIFPKRINDDSDT